MNSKDHYNQEINLSDLNILFRYVTGIDLAKDIEKSREPKEKPTIDMLLDQYNDYKTLYDMFGDHEYKILADKTMIELRNFN